MLRCTWESMYFLEPGCYQNLAVRLADEEMEGFLKEARTIAGLTHPNILRVLEFGVEANVPFLVLEFAQMVHCGNAIQREVFCL